MRDGWRLALGTFTVVRVTPPRSVDRRVAAVAMVLAPLTAVPALAVWVLLGVAVNRGLLPAGVAAALAVAVVAALSRAMHLDGLADTADGLAASYDRERALEVMRRGDTGPAGAATLVLSLLLQVACLSTLLATPTGLALAAAALVASRLAAAVTTRRGVPAARSDGLGRAVAGSVGTGAAWAGVAAVAGSAALAVAVTAQAASGRGPASAATWTAALAGLLVVTAAVAGAVGLLRRAVTRLGGVTGDVIGAAIEVALGAALVTACVAAALLAR